LDKNSATVVQESELESFLRDASAQGANKVSPQDYSEYIHKAVDYLTLKI